MKMVNKPVYIAASLLAILSAVAVSSSGALSVFAQGADVPVSIVPGASTLADKSYSPNPVEVKVGQKVVWTNDDTVLHTVTSGELGAADAGKLFDSGFTKLASKGTTFEYTFTTPGEFKYHCQVHPGMVGTVKVT
jgi:plastocyanin